MTGLQGLGRRAEEYAAGYVASLGWRILERNVANRYGELDLVAVDGTGELVVVEVRFRTVGEVQSPLDSVGPKKLRALVRAGRAYVSTAGWAGFWRIDLVGITAHQGKWSLEHIRDVTAGMDVLT